MGNVNPVFRCCVPNTTLTEAGNLGLATNKVELAASELFSLRLFTAYHTSILVNGEEFFFSDSGIFSDRALISHQGTPSERMELGYSTKTGAQLLQALQPYFRPGTYDLVRKNCNSFSDCAGYYLLGKRLERRFSALEKIGQANTELLKQVTKGAYMPNAAAADFQAETVIASLDKLDEEKAGDATPSKSRPALGCGVRVTIIGLTNQSQLNGQGATVLRYSPVNGRWEAKLHLGGEVKALRAENLRPAGELALESGDRVRVHSLKSDAGQALNGKEGQVVRYMHEVSRYEVSIDGFTKALKAENLQAL
mmetsp:Transcript_87134/g.164295  ORF Transcript_87134/g.164295 Transcript_87134/m.164295 type:complete len:309 (+) Transcript_87134:53-979(+)